MSYPVLIDYFENRIEDNLKSLLYIYKYRDSCIDIDSDINIRLDNILTIHVQYLKSLNMIPELQNIQI